MRRNDVRFAVAAREDGLRRVRSLTTRIGAAGVVSSAAIAIALGHPAGAAVHAVTGDGTASQHPTAPNENSSSSSSSQPSSGPASSSPDSQQPSSSPPSSQPSSSSQQSGSQPSSSPQAPAQNPAPAAGPSQVVSGGS